MQLLFRSIAILLAVFCTSPAWARGGGGCLREGTRILTPAGMTAIENLKPGDTVLGMNGGTLQAVRVENVTKLDVDQYLEFTVGGKNFLVTPEHPIMTGPGEFRTAGALKRGDRVFTGLEGELKPGIVSRVRSAKADKPAYNLLVLPGGVFFPEGVAVHNKGCFLPDTLILKADGTQVSISTLAPDDRIMGFTDDGVLVRSAVRNIHKSVVHEHVILKTDAGTLRVTGEHPFWVAPGTYKTVEVLRPGDYIFHWNGKALEPNRIISKETVKGRILVYNIQTDAPHTYLAGQMAVHNKGGGGCFPPGTLIRTPEKEVPIESLSPGDVVLGMGPDGKQAPVAVESIHSTRARILTLKTGGGTLFTTVDHPVKLTGGDFREAGDLIPGAFVDALENGSVRSRVVESVSEDIEERQVFNLSVAEPHVFIASDFVVHNKGGSSSSSSSGSRSSSGSSGSDSSDDSWWVPAIFFGVWSTIFFGALYLVFKGRKRVKENLDFVYSKSEIARKSGKTVKLLQFISAQDPSFAPDKLGEIARAAFVKLQECWGSRKYDPMQPLLMPSLYTEHVGQLRGMEQTHEINKIEDLKVEKVDIVNVRYTEKPNQREFTALISASARDYYVDDRDGKFLRGDKSAAKFQEFWTFQLMDGKWLLREVEQSGESDFLKHENFAEMLTDQSIKGIYGEEAGKEGAAGPWLEKGEEKKATRIERLLNFLAQTDKLWDRQKMLERARHVFLEVYLAREAGDPKTVPADDLYPETAKSLADQLQQWQAQDMRVEYRNLCVRKVELIHVRNYQENEKDEFTVRISAHAQKIVNKSGKTVNEDQYVTPFDDFWTFGRLDQKWKLKEVLPTAEGQKRMEAENLDEDSSAGQLDWYYKQTRAN